MWPHQLSEVINIVSKAAVVALVVATVVQYIGHTGGAWGGFENEDISR